MTGIGFTGSFEPAGVIHKGSEVLKCTCGGWIEVEWGGELVVHSEPLDVEAEHIVVPFWTKSVWRYELVE